MRFYKSTIVFAIGLLLELGVAVASSVLVKENGEWLASLILPYFAPHSPLFYGVLTLVEYLSSATALAFYVKSGRFLPKGVLLTLLEGIAEIVTLLFFFEFTYEITSFFSATATTLLSLFITSLFLSENDVAGLARLPDLGVKLYLWVVLYCILTINFA